MLECGASFYQEIMYISVTVVYGLQIKMYVHISGAGI